MRSLDISKQIVSYLSANLDAKTIKATPEALFAPEIYDMIESGTVILVWLDSAPSYIDTAPRNERGLPNGQINKYMRFCISVGFRSLNEAPDLDVIVEEIELLLTNLDIDDIAPLRPSAISKMTSDGNKNHWRQIWFDTTYRLSVPVHTI
jgi:hypothetical protein